MREEMLSFAQRAGIPALDLTEAIGDIRGPRARECGCERIRTPAWRAMRRLAPRSPSPCGSMAC